MPRKTVPLDDKGLPVIPKRIFLGARQDAITAAQNQYQLATDRARTSLDLLREIGQYDPELAKKMAPTVLRQLDTAFPGIGGALDETAPPDSPYPTTATSTGTTLPTDPLRRPAALQQEQLQVEGAQQSVEGMRESNLSAAESRRLATAEGARQAETQVQKTGLHNLSLSQLLDEGLRDAKTGGKPGRDQLARATRALTETGTLPSDVILAGETRQKIDTLRPVFGSDAAAFKFMAQTAKDIGEAPGLTNKEVIARTDYYGRIPKADEGDGSGGSHTPAVQNMIIKAREQFDGASNDLSTRLKAMFNITPTITGKAVGGKRDPLFKGLGITIEHMGKGKVNLPITADLQNQLVYGSTNIDDIAQDVRKMVASATGGGLAPEAIDFDKLVFEFPQYTDAKTGKRVPARKINANDILTEIGAIRSAGQTKRAAVLTMVQADPQLVRQHPYEVIQLIEDGQLSPEYAQLLTPEQRGAIGADGASGAGGGANGTPPPGADPEARALSDALEQRRKESRAEIDDLRRQLQEITGGK